MNSYALKHRETACRVRGGLDTPSPYNQEGKLIIGKIFITAVALILLLPAGWVGATDETVETDKVIVTATRTPLTLDKIGGNSATEISTEEIEAKQQNFVQDMLKGVPGLDFASNDGPGTTTSVFLRGADSKNTLVLVDGVILNDPSSPNRSADLGNLNADNIERIEIIRGAMSVLYGSRIERGT